MPKSRKSQPAFENFPLADADSCVKCGLCLPHCPTYTVTRVEGDSPRGRIALMQGLAQGVLDAEGRTTEHLDGCLTCRACETVCPAQVPYGELIDAARSSLWRAGHRPGLRWRLLAWWRRTPRRINLLGQLLRLFNALQLRRLLRALSRRRLFRAVTLAGPTGRWPEPGYYAAPDARGPNPDREVRLFLGCIARPLDARVAHAAIRCLNAVGYSVHIPAEQGCCGAMDQHAGDTAAAERHRTRNLSAFPGDMPVLATASGCGIHLREHHALHTEDVAGFIARELRDANITLTEHKETLLVHSPCTLKQMRGDAAVIELLEQLPGATISRLPYSQCCGAAGTYLFEQPDMSEQLGDAAARAVAAQTATMTADVLVTSNIGCALQFRYALEKNGTNIRVAHPLEILAERLARQ
jgi:glycolate oxidase iron-sulfur subunit